MHAVTMRGGAGHCLRAFVLASFLAALTLPSFALSESSEYGYYDRSRLADDMYCGKQICYDVLGVSKTASIGAIKKAYRSLSREYHPDVSDLPEQEATAKFRQIAAAYEALSETRAAYDDYLAHPERAIYNRYAFYKAKYAPQTNPAYVIIGFIAAVSLFHYYSRLNRYNAAMRYFTTYDKNFNVQVKRLATERFQLAKSASQKKGDRRKQKELMDKLTREARAELAKEIQIDGGYKKPTWHDIFAVQLVMLPVRIAKGMYWHFSWHYRFNYKREAYGEEEVEYLTARALGCSVPALRGGCKNDDELRDLLSRRLWEGDNLAAYQQEKLDEVKRKRPNLYKRYVRSKR